MKSGLLAGGAATVGGGLLANGTSARAQERGRLNVSMTKAIDRLKAEGQEISDEVLAAVSPYQTSHINRFGQYQLHARRAPDPLPFLRKPPNVEISTVDPPGLAAAG
jgi:hypothetical protein